MFINSHIATGYLAGKAAGDKKEWILLWIIAATVPDLDGLWSDTVAGHHSILHTPIFWIVVCGIIWWVGSSRNNQGLERGALIILAGTMLHLFTDWITSRTVGIQWLYPFSNTNYWIYPISPEKGNIPIWEMVVPPYINFYFENKILFYGEVGLNILALGWLGKTYLGNHEK